MRKAGDRTRRRRLNKLSRAGWLPHDRGHVSGLTYSRREHRSGDRLIAVQEDSPLRPWRAASSWRQVVSTAHRDWAGTGPVASVGAGCRLSALNGGRWGKCGGTPQPFHGYFFKILKAQGQNAASGAYNYVVNGVMIGGFAMVAWPARWDHSGVMTFVVNQDGDVYQKNLSLHANMFLVKRAAEVMNSAVTVLPAETSLDAFLQQAADDQAVQHVVVTRDEHIIGVMRLNPGMRRGLAQTDTGLTLGDAAGLKFTIVRDTSLVFDVIRRIWAKDAVLAVVVGGHGAPRGGDVRGIIGKEQVADSVAASVQNYPD